MTRPQTRLADKAMLVKLTIRKASLSRVDTHVTNAIQQQYGDAYLKAVTKLFQSPGSPVHTIMSAFNEAYSYHKANTLPHIDAGPRILPTARYFDYTQEMKYRIGKLEALLDSHMPNYDQLVQDDLAVRTQAAQAAGRASTANVADYPSASDFRQAMSIELRFQPMPDTRHFLFDLNEEDLAACERAEAEAVELARADTINRMLKPLHALVKRLGEYQGQKGERFHNSVVENVIEGCRTAKSLAIDPTPEMLQQIDELESTAKQYLAGVEIIKGSANARASAKSRLEEVAAKMSMFA